MNKNKFKVGDIITDATYMIENKIDGCNLFAVVGIEHEINGYTLFDIINHELITTAETYLTHFEFLCYSPKMVDKIIDMDDGQWNEIGVD